jgi:hypothetical protein
VLKKFLHNIVAEDVLHKRYRIFDDLAEDPVFLVAVSSLELFLDESRAMLVAAELDDVTVDVLAGVLVPYPIKTCSERRC